MERAEFWKNWQITPNGCAFNVEFFANSFEHAERALGECGAFLPPHPASLDGYIRPEQGGGFTAGFIAPLQIATAIREHKESAKCAPR